jgi:hypothetical protein
VRQLPGRFYADAPMAPVAVAAPPAAPAVPVTWVAARTGPGYFTPSRPPSPARASDGQAAALSACETGLSWLRVLILGAT